MSHTKGEDVHDTVLPFHDVEDELWRKPEHRGRRGVCLDQIKTIVVGPGQRLEQRCSGCYESIESTYQILVEGLVAG